MDTSCQRANPGAALPPREPGARRWGEAARPVGQRCVYTPLNQLGAMRLCWVNDSRAQGTPQLPRALLLNVNQVHTHTHTRVNTHAGRVYTVSCSSFHLCAAAERTCADTFINLRPSQPHLPLTSTSRRRENEGTGPDSAPRRDSTGEAASAGKQVNVHPQSARGERR